MAMTMYRVLLVLAVLLGVATTPPAAAQPTSAYPTKIVRLIVPQPAGGGTDTVARVLSAQMQEQWGQPVVVENRPGANGIIGTDFVAKAAPDGYTIVMGGIGPHGINPALFPNLPYDAVKDFEPIILTTSAPNVLVTRGDLPVQNVRDLVALLNQKRDRPLTYGSNGNGTSVHLAAAMFSLIAGVEMLHVPYKGSAPVVAAILGGEVDVAYVSILDIMPHIRPGGVRALATGGSRRSDAMPNVPTIAEAGYPGAESAAWFGILAPAHTPREIINRLNLEFNKALKTPSVRQRLSPNGDTELIGGSPEAFARFIGDEIAKWTKVIKDGHIKPD